MLDIDLTKEPYIPNARDAVIAYCGYTPEGCFRVYCVTCCDSCPLTDPRKIYGDLYVPEGELERCDDADICDGCRVKLLELSRRCQEEHDTQQAQWARLSRPTYVIEMGMKSDIRCRVY